jgi:glycosyltransferase involved in cell wall biosynthesis
MTESQRRILHVVGTMNPGGLETWLLNVLAHIEPDRFQFHFCVCGSETGIYGPEVERLGGTVLRCPKGADLWSFRRRFRKVLREGKYDVVHSHVFCFSGALLRWASQEGVPIRIAHSHNTNDGKPSSFSRDFYRRTMKSWINRYATHGLAASKLAAAELFGENWQADERFQALDYGLDLRPFQEPFNRDRVRAELGIPKDAPVVGHVGRFDDSKNHCFLLEVAGAVLKSRPDTHFLLVGDGSLRPEIEVLARRMNLSRRVHFLGTRTDVPRLMLAAMDLFLFPSLHEGFGVCLLEAQAAGLRCVVSDAIPEEVVRVPETVEFLPLSAGKDYWSTRVMQTLDAPRGKLTPALDRDLQFNFSTQRSLRELLSIYSTDQDAVHLIAAEQHV